MRNLSSVERIREIDPHYTHRISKIRPRLTKNNRSLRAKYSVNIIMD